MRKAMLATLFLEGAAMAAPLPALAWDYPGHRIVGAVADLVMSQRYPAAYAKVTALLATKDAAGNPVQRTLSEVAVFPDCAKDEVAYCKRKPTGEEIAYVLRNLMHKSFHYTNSPYQRGKYVAGGVGTSETDVVQMIGYATAQLEGKKPYIYEVNLTNTEAVWLLAHLLGDLHQPLHVGQVYFDTTCERIVDANASRTIEAVSTLGGNLIKMPSGPANNLHLYWDSNTILNAMQKEGVGSDEHAFAQKLVAAPPSGWETSGDPKTWAEKWAAEAMDLAATAYEAKTIKITHDKSHDRRPSFPSATISCGLAAEVTPAYEDWARETAQSQVQKAGFRLAALLKAIFEP